MPKVNEVVREAHERLLADARQLLTKESLNETELAERLGIKAKPASRLIKELQTLGANFTIVDNRYLLHGVVDIGGKLVLKPQDRGDGWIAFGFITDKHLCNKHSRLDVLRTAYKVFKEEGIKDVFDGGNWIDGEARFNRHELLVFGLDDQCDYLIENHPQVEGITTHYVSGDDHEGWYAQRERINIGQYLEMKARDAGRNDLHFMGHVESDVELKARNGHATMRVMHPGGGSAYAFSYAPQKIVESFQGGEKPQILLIGHYHKRDVCYPREVHVVSGGCVEDQTMFMRKNKIAAHVGFTILRIKQDQSTGAITRFQEEFFPFYDRAFYESRY